MQNNTKITEWCVRACGVFVCFYLDSCEVTCRVLYNINRVGVEPNSYFISDQLEMKSAFGISFPTRHLNVSGGNDLNIGSPMSVTFMISIYTVLMTICMQSMENLTMSSAHMYCALWTTSQGCCVR